MRLRRYRKIHLYAGDAGANDRPNRHTDIVQPKPGRQPAEKLRIEADSDQGAEHHVARYAAERLEYGDSLAHHTRYDAPLPVLNTSTSESRATVPLATSCSMTARAAPPSGAASIPVDRPIRRVASPMACSLTACAVPPLSRRALRISRSTKGAPTRSPLACVTGFSHGTAWSFPS